MKIARAGGTLAFVRRIEFFVIPIRDWKARNVIAAEAHFCERTFVRRCVQILGTHDELT